MSKIAFLGDSHTHAGRWENFFPKHEIPNHGIPGEKSAEIFLRLEDVLAEKPTQIFLMMGINDLGDGLRSDVILRNYQLTVDRIKKAKNIQLIVQSILPVNFELFTTDNFNSKDILETNQLLKILCEKEKITFVDLYTPFSTYLNELIPLYTYDGLHLNEAGYRIWKNCLQYENLI
jgi:lysophospholipase L1-like esterase